MREDGWPAKQDGDDAAQATLRNLVTVAREKSKGQGVVQGSTMFVRNLAHSVGQSHRNLKLGLAFVTMALVVVAGSLGYLVYRSISLAEGVKSGVGGEIARSNASLTEKIDRIASGMDGYGAVVTRLEKQLAASEAARSAAQQELLQARQETERVKAEMEALQKNVHELRQWAEKFNATYVRDREMIVQRIPGLALQPKQ